MGLAGSTPDRRWMVNGACVRRRELPWLADADQVTPWEDLTMRCIRRDCPVRRRCEDFAWHAGVIGGFLVRPQPRRRGRAASRDWGRGMTSPDIGNDVIRELAIEQAVCVRPVMRRVTDRATGHETTVPIPSGATPESRCPSCAAKARRLRITQCAEGWHADAEPVPLYEPAVIQPVQGNEYEVGEQEDDDDAQRLKSVGRCNQAPLLSAPRCLGFRSRRSGTGSVQHTTLGSAQLIWSDFLLLHLDHPP